MKLLHWPTLLLIVASSNALVAAPAKDRQIENAAKASYNYRTVLADNVKVKANDGIVTLTVSSDLA
jgi:hyperosmotically inducible protein